MKFKKTAFFLTLLLSHLFFTNLSAQELQKTPTGSHLCLSFFEFLSDNNFKPQAQPLLNYNQNDFPYNIYIENIGRYSNSENLENVLFVFEMQSAYEKREIIRQFINYLKITDLTCNPTILFAYGEVPKFEKPGMIYGTDVFLDDFYFEDDFTAVLIDLDSPKTKISSSSNQIIAPGNLIKNCLNAFLKNKLPVTNRFIFLSQLYRLSFQQDRRLDSFFEKDIPAIKIDFDSQLDQKIILSTLTDMVKDFSNFNWDQHFILYNLFGSFHILTEKHILTILFIVIFTLLLFIFVFGYINSFIKFEAWKKIRYVWYAAPITFVLIAAGLEMGKGLFYLFNPQTEFGKIFLLLCLQLSFAVVLTSFFYYFLSFLNHKFTERSVDYLVLLSTFINQSFFAFFDISLFPMFLLIFLAAFSAIFYRKFFSHLYLFFILILLLFPYTFSFLGSFESSQILSFLLGTKVYQFSLALIFTPVLLLYLRIVIKFRQTHPQKRSLALFVIVYAVSIIFTQTEICLISVPLRNKSVTKTQMPVVISSDNELIKLTHTDKVVFDDIIRTINITLSQKPELCDVQLFSPNSQSLKYSDYDFEVINATTSHFLIPQNPPQNLTFTYGTTEEPGFVKITVIFPTDEENTYIRQEKIFAVSEAE
ncbi:hypothetical protein [Treponema sp. C6A8]|uniref:hypothetical protein n=1 Tax=Treponema sp. C6A8 TaxID=1410609 RepID=UPI000485CE6F|nr:hypothetical protein [Treponema sp. C6A8]